MSNQGNLLRSSALTKKVPSSSDSATPFVQLASPLPVVNVTMGGNGQPVTNRTGAKQGQLRNDVVLLPPKSHGRVPGPNPDGSMPVLEINMNGSAPQIVGTKTRPEGSSVRVFEAKGGRATAAMPVEASPFTPDMMMLCRHLVSTYQGLPDLTAEHKALADATVAVLDEALAATAVVDVSEPPQRMVVAGQRGAGPQIGGPRRVPSAPRASMGTAMDPSSIPDDLAAVIAGDIEE